MPISKVELDNQIKNLKQAFFVGLAAYELLGMMEDISILNYPPHSHIIANWSKHPGRKEIEREQFLKLLLRAMITEPFETIKLYCEQTSQTDQFESQSWHTFARIVRNAISHNLRFVFTDFDKSNRLPLNWNGIPIDVLMEGQELTITILPPDKVLQLVEEMHSFVQHSMLT